MVPELRWRRWRWEVREHEIDLQRGILVVRRTLIPMARVQHVETERGLIGQVLGLSTVEIHTAAGSHEIPLLRDGDAGAIRARIAELRAPTMGERLHPAAIAVYAADALRQGAVPLLVLLGISVFGGGFDAEAALRGAMFALAGTAVATLAGWFRWSTTRYSLADQTIRLREGLLSVKEVEIPFARVQAVDVLQGPTQRLFGVHRVDVQTGGGGEGGEIVLSAVDDAEVERIRALLGRPAAAEDAPAAPSGACPGARSRWRRRPRGSSACSCRSPRRVAQMSQQLFDDPIEGERTIVGALPDGTLGWVLVAAGIIVLAWLLGALGTVVAFGGFAVRREGDDLRIRRGLIQRRQVTVRVARVRAVRVWRACRGRRSGWRRCGSR